MFRFALTRIIVTVSEEKTVLNVPFNPDFNFEIPVGE